MLDRRSVLLVLVALAFAFAMPLATAHAAIQARLEPWFADVDPSTMMLSPDTAKITGAAGACVSTATACDPTALTLPYRSVAVAVKVLAALSAGTSPAAKLTCHAPVLSAAAVLVTPPQVTETVEFAPVPPPASDVPLTTTPLSRVVAFTMSLIATTSMVGIVVVVSTRTACVAAALVLLNEFIWVALMLV